MIIEGYHEYVMLESLENRLRKTEERRYLVGNAKWACWPFRDYETEELMPLPLLYFPMLLYYNV